VEFLSAFLIHLSSSYFCTIYYLAAAAAADNDDDEEDGDDTYNNKLLMLILPDCMKASHLRLNPSKTEVMWAPVSSWTRSPSEMCRCYQL